MEPEHTASMTIEDLARLVITHRIHMHIGVHKDDVMADPPVICIQFDDPAEKAQPTAFRMPIRRGNPQLERALEVAIRSRIREVSSQKMRLVKTLDEIAGDTTQP